MLIYYFRGFSGLRGMQYWAKVTLTRNIHRKYKIDQHTTVLNLYSISMNKIVVTEVMTVKYFTESKFDTKYVHTVKSEI